MLNTRFKKEKRRPAHTAKIVGANCVSAPPLRNTARERIKIQIILDCRNVEK